MQITYTINKLDTFVRISADDNENIKEYLLYIYKFDKHIRTEAAQNSPIFSVNIDSTGIFRFHAFAKYKNGLVIDKISEPFFINSSFKSHEPLDVKCLERGSFFSREIDNTNFWCYFKKSPYKRLFILLAGNIKRDNPVSLFRFDRWSWDEKFPGSILCISDPSIHMAKNGLTLGWYIGTHELNITDLMSRLAIEVANQLEIKPKKIICYGSSGGGFASIALAHKLGATAVAINPQTNIMKYEDKPVKRFLEFYSPSGYVDENRFSLIERLKNKNKTNIVYVQNKFDYSHVNDHLMPIMETLNFSSIESSTSIDGCNELLCFEDDNGHGGEPADLVNKIIQLSIKYSDKK